MIDSQKALDMFLIFRLYQGQSSGQLALIADCEPSEIKRYMREFEQWGYGEFTIFDGMWHFWFSPFGEALYQSLQSDDV